MKRLELTSHASAKQNTCKTEEILEPQSEDEEMNVAVLVHLVQDTQDIEHPFG